MKSKFQKLGIVLALFLGVSLTASAQKFNVESVIMELEKPIDDTEKDLEKCIEWITKASQHPKTQNSASMYYYKGMTYLKVANVNSELTKANPDAILIALESFNNAIKNDSKGKFTKNSQTNLLNVAIGLYNRGYTEYNAGEYEKSYGTFEKVLPLLEYDVNGDLKRNNLTSAAVGKMLAYCALGMKDNAKAMKAFQELIDNGNTDPNNYLSMAELKLADEDTTGALAIIQEGREMNELDRNLINRELDLYLKLGRSKELIDKLDAAIESDPSNTIYYFARAISYEGTGELDKAAADYDKIIELDENYYDAYYNKGVMYLNKVSELVDEMNSKNLYSAKDIAPYEAKINDNYGKAIKLFEHVFENNDDMKPEDKMELARTMRKIYAQLDQMDKYAEMKAYIDAN